MNVERARKALIKVSYACNNRCLFCHSAPLRGRVAANLTSLKAKITAARMRGFEMVVLSGGEPTIHPNLGALLKHIRREGLALGFVTNGRRFAHRPFLEGLARFRLRYVYMSLHGAEAATHDRMVGTEAFPETLAAVRNLACSARETERSPGSAGGDLRLTVNCVVTNWNIDELEALVDLLGDIGGMRVKFSYLEPKGEALTRLDELLPPPDVAARRIRAAIAHGTRYAHHISLSWDALPFCLMPDHLDLYDDLATNGIEVMSEADELDFFPVDHANKGYAPICSACALKERCPGLYHHALERYADTLKPHRGPRAEGRGN